MLACLRLLPVQQAVAIAACTGIGMALVSPNTQSLIADLYPAAARGKSFGGTLMIVCLGEKLQSTHRPSPSVWLQIA